MSFTSIKFIGFLCASFLFYFLTPKNFRWISLLLFSLVYYYLSSSKLVVILILETLITYVTGIVLSHNNIKLKNISDLSAAEKKTVKETVKKKNGIVSKTGIILVLGILILMKYEGFLAENLNYALNGIIPVFTFVLPLGISFYTLQAISYMVDVSKNKYEGERNFFRFLLYMSFFPQLLQGPIPRFNKLADQLYEGHDFDYRRFCFGLQLVSWGLIKKAVIADRLSTVVSMIFDNPGSYSGLMILFGAVMYSIQIYGDFSGGIDVVRGIGEVFGVTMDDNFRQPYFSRSIEEFWRRWHITLGAWMKDYVFYPLSLSKTFGKIGKYARKTLGDSTGKKIPPVIAMFVVYLLVGIWHGANWKYVAYGIWNGFFISGGILLENQYKNTVQRLHINPDSGAWKSFQMIRTFIICSIGRIFSRASDLSAAFGLFASMISKLFSPSSLLVNMAELGLDYKNWMVVILMVLLVFFVDSKKEKGENIRENIAAKPIYIRWMLYYALIMAVLIFGLYGPGYDASSFIYGKF